MACVLYRRFPRVAFQFSSTFSTIGWTRRGRGQKYLTPSKKSIRFKDARQDAVGHTNPYVTHMVDNVKEPEENGKLFDPEYPMKIPEPHKNISATRSQESPKNNFLNLIHKDSSKTRPRIFSKTLNKFRALDDVESFSSKDDPRAFQQRRPEYKSVCYSTGRPMETSIAEGELLLQNVKDSPTPGEISELLEKLSYLPETYLEVLRSNKKFKTLCSYGTSNLHLYSNPELIRILGSFVRLTVPTNFPVLKGYEQEFCHRVLHLSTNELLLVADMFRYIGFSVPKFLKTLYSCIQARCSDLNLVQAIQLVYIVGEGRRVPPELLEQLESLVTRYVDSMNLEEIGAVCLGFFKTRNGLSENLMRKLGDIISENIEEISNYALVNVLKMFRFTRVDHMQFFSQVGKVAHKRIPEMGTQGIMHVVLTFAAMHILNEDLMSAVAHAMPGRVSYCRSKDLAKFLWSFGVLKYEPPNADAFYSAFTNQILRNLEEFKRFPEHFLTCLMGLAFCQQFPFDLIDIALSEEFVMRSTKISMFELKKDLFTIAGTVEIECPQYRGNKISQEFCKDVTDMLVELSNRDIHVKPEVIEATTLLQYALGGPQYVKEHMILPHTRSKDLEVRLDVHKNPIAFNTNVEKVDRPLQNLQNVKITDGLLSQLTNTSKEISASSMNAPVKEPWGANNGESARMTCDEQPVGQPEVMRLAVQVTNRNQYIYGSKQLLGLHTLKRRQLSKLGYVVVEIPYWEWFPLARRTRSEKVAYLRNKVLGCT